MIEKLAEVERRFEGVENDLQNPAVVSDPREIQRLGRLRAELEPVVLAVRDYRKTRGDLAQAEELLSDPEMRELALAEVEPLRERRADLEERLRRMLVPRDPMDEKAVIVEIRPAAGGDEAALFANELFRMYARYAERRGWRVDVHDHEESGIGGLDKVVFALDAPGAYSQLKHESGVHRVQRVPATESQGRIHTSTVTVAVLPEAEEVDVQVDPKDLEISTFRSSSAGGQHMQKNETAIRIVHKPTGIVVTCQDERSQQQNKLKAMTDLRTRILAAETERANAARSGLRAGLIGTGDRSEKIRTYNFPDGRVTDHRIKFTLHSLQAFLDGDLQPMVDALHEEETSRRLAASEEP